MKIKFDFTSNPELYSSSNGEEKTIREWSDILGIKRTTLDMRLNAYGWSPEKAFSTKI